MVGVQMGPEVSAAAPAFRLTYAWSPPSCPSPAPVLCTSSLTSSPHHRAGQGFPFSASRLGHLQSQRRVLGLRHFKDSGIKMKSVLLDGLECNLIPKMLTHL